ncbi:MAG: NTP transferase domain-containing protein [Parachlamydiaceae bacterium]|nr:NTP transferase domain-containing protein [Parachlamydiaceae bacterium]
MNEVVTIILGGGQGTRLNPLTLTYCKPAACVGGKYRLIDIPISNALNSGCSKIFILTQFLSTPLHQHLARTYRLDTFSNGFIELLTAEQKPNQQTWFQGTADAVRQNIEYIAHASADYFLILSGDQLYNMDFKAMVRFAQETDADLVVAALPVAESEAKRMGVLKINEDRFITEFYEKPQAREVLDHMRLPEFTLKQIVNEEGKAPKEYLGSMGIYLFKRQALFDLLDQDPNEDFGKHLIPTKVKQGKVAAFLFDGYWEDIGTIASFFEANIAMTREDPPLNCYDEKNPIFSQPLHLPAPKVTDTEVFQSIICEGSYIEAKSVKSCVLGPRTVVKKGTTLDHVYVMGHDFYAPAAPNSKLPHEFSIGENCTIERAIIDKHVYIGNGVQLINKQNLTHYNSEYVYVRDGIILVTRGTSIPDGFVF